VLFAQNQTFCPPKISGLATPLYWSADRICSFSFHGRRADSPWKATHGILAGATWVCCVLGTEALQLRDRNLHHSTKELFKVYKNFMFLWEVCFKNLRCQWDYSNVSCNSFLVGFGFHVATALCKIFFVGYQTTACPSWCIHARVCLRSTNTNLLAACLLR